MSQAGIVDVEGAHPQIPTTFIANVGTAVPINNDLEILGAAVSAHNIPVETVASGNTVTTEVQYTSSAASSSANSAGLSSFNSAQFNVDANGFVSLTAGDDLHITPYIVSASGASVGASYTTIQAAVNAANSAGGGVIYIQPGTYTENLTLFSNIVLWGSSEQTTIIVGTHTPPSSGTLNLFRCTFQGASAIFSSAAAGTTAIIMEDCSVNVTNGYTFDLLNWTSSGSVAVDDIGPFGTNDGFFRNTGGSSLFSFSAGLGNGSGNSMILSGALVIAGGDIQCPISFQTGSSLQADNAFFKGSLTFSNNSTGTINNCRITTGSTAAITMSSSGSVQIFNTTIDSTASPAIAGSGAGTLSYAGLVFPNNASFAGTLTLATVAWRPYAQAIASTNAAKVGTSAFNSTFFTVDGNGFVSLSGTGVGQTITGNSGGPLSPTAGNWNILGAGSLTAAGVGSTLTVQLTGITNHAVQVGGSGTTLTQIGPSATIGSVLASNGASADPSFQTISSLGGIISITGNSGGAEVPSSGNFNIVGTGSITVAGSANTQTIQLTGLTNHNVLVGAGTPTITNVAPSATSGVPLISNGSAADPSFGTATVPGGGTGVTSTTAFGLIAGGTTSTGNLQNAGTGTSGQVYVSGGSAALGTWKAPSSIGSLILIQTQTASSSATLNFTNIGSFANYLLVLDSFQPATNGATLRLAVSNNNGSSYLNSGYNSGLNSSLYNTASLSNSNSTTNFIISGPTLNTGTYCSSLKLQNFGIATFVTVSGIGSWTDSTAGTGAFGTMGGIGPTGINAFQLFYSAGNISFGTAALYGISPT